MAPRPWNTAYAWWSKCVPCWTRCRIKSMANVFDELFALVTPERLLHDPRATGEGVSVCVIDSGIERQLLVDRYRERGVAIQPIEGAIFTAALNEPLPYEGRQSTPHGTTVADI